jgi:hypothetical protein
MADLRLTHRTAIILYVPVDTCGERESLMGHVQYRPKIRGEANSNKSSACHAWKA